MTHIQIDIEYHVDLLILPTHRLKLFFLEFYCTKFKNHVDISDEY